MNLSDEGMESRRSEIDGFECYRALSRFSTLTHSIVWDTLSPVSTPEPSPPIDPGRRSELIDLQEAADRLGVHYQTAYRWVRTGRLTASMFDGKYLVEPSALDVARASRATPKAPSPPGDARVSRDAEAMHTALVGGDDVSADRIARTLVDQGLPIIDLIERVLAPPLRRIGQAWHEGRLTIWVERRASTMVERILADVSTNPRGRRRGTAMVAAVTGDRHTLPTTMAAVVLRDANWQVHHLGADMPPEELIAFCEEHTVDVAVISSTNSDVADVAADTVERLEAAGTPALLGGPGSSLRDLLALAVERTRP